MADVVWEVCPTCEGYGNMQPITGWDEDCERCDGDGSIVKEVEPDG